MLRTRKPLAKVGKRGKELLAIRDKAWPIVRRNADYICEGCGVSERKKTLTWSHAFGRNGTGAGLGDWAHVPELAFALCLRPGDRFGSCHTRYDDYLDAPLRVRLERKALDRFVKKYHVTIDPVASPLENIRTAVRQLETAGAVPLLKEGVPMD